MDYEKKYKEALEWARKVMQGKVGFVLDEVLEKFPELKESEDERIRKDITEYLKALNDNLVGTKQINSWIAYIEKQGEKETANKVKPKFMVGDWVIDKQGIVHQIANVIENVTNHTFGYDIVGGGYFNDSEEGVRLWTIEDAKDGDVLTTDTWTFIYKKCQDKSAYYYCAVSTFNEFSISDTGNFDSNYVHPATKEQRDLLFAKMKEAGYEWDADKKELRKIEQKPA